MPTDKRPQGRPPEARALLDRLHRAGWSIAEYTIWFVGPRAWAWIVVGEQRRERLLTMGATRVEAAMRACEQAEAIGELAPREGEETGGGPHSSGE